MRLLNYIPLKSKLLILVILPFLALGYFTVDKIRNERRVIAGLNDVRMRVGEIEHTAGLIHELQKERDFSVKFLLNPLLENQIQLDQQIAQTDTVLKHFGKYLKSELQDTTYLSNFSGLSATRASITWFSITPDEIKAYFDNLIRMFMDRVAQVSSDANTPKTKESMTAYIALLKTKESLGQIRNDVNEALVFGMFQNLGYGNFSVHKGAFESGLRDFMRYSPKEIKSKFELEFQGGTTLNTLDMINYCFENRSNRLTAFTSDDWWLGATGTINILYDLEIFVVNRIQNDLLDQTSALEKEIDELYVFLSAVLTLMLLLVSLVAKSITAQLAQIKKAALYLQEGNVNVQAKVYSNDAIGTLAIVFNRMAEDAKVLAGLAEQIGEGNYDVQLDLRGEDDILSKSLISMKEKLKLSREAIKKNYEELKDAYQYKSDFLANMSHELRTPLNSMLILSKILSENESGNLKEDQIESLNIIYKSGNNLLSLINDILDLSKMEAGKLDVEIQEMNLSVLLHDLHDLFQPVARENKLDFSIVLENDVPHMIYSDEMRLGQVLKNLLSNSMKFTPSGGKVSLVINVSNETISFAVLDTGIGIEKEKQDLIFEAFSQADGSTSRNYGGTGLGLSISLQLIKLLNGSITVESEKNKGSVFKVSIPLKSDSLNQLLTLDFKENKSLPETENFIKEPIQEFSKKKEKEEDKNFFSIKLTTSQKSAIRNKKILLIEEDISKVFHLSSIYAQFDSEIIDVSTVDEFNEKFTSDIHVIILDKVGFSEQEVTSFLNLLESKSLKYITCGDIEMVDSVENIREISTKILELSN